MPNFLDQVVFARNLSGRYETRGHHARAVVAGRELRVANGAYISSELWRKLDARSRYLTCIHAVAETRREAPIISHWSAAAIHDLPVVGAWPAAVHTIVGPTRGGRSRNGVVKHSIRLGDEDVVEIDGTQVTSIARTLVDIASCGSPLSAIAMIDRALLIDDHSRSRPLVLFDELDQMWESMLPFKAHARARDLIDFGENGSDSPLESVSRFNMRVVGCPRPRLQVPFHDRDGFIGKPDFAWLESRHLGEADGGLKYLDERYRSGRSAEQVVLDERIREDRLRAVSCGFSRWGWRIALNPQALRNRLSDAGLPMGVPWVY